MSKMCPIKDYVKGNGTPQERYYREVFSFDAAFYYHLISNQAKQALEESKKIIDPLTLNGSIHASTLSNYIRQATYAREQVENQKVINKENKARTLKQDKERRAGFIHASILFYAILNIGIIIAVTLIIL